MKSEPTPYKTTWQKHDELIDAGYVLHKDDDGFWHVSNPAPDSYVVATHRQKGPLVRDAYDLLS